MLFRWSTRALGMLVLAVLVLGVSSVSAAGSASADTSRIVSVVNTGPQRQVITVYSASMGREIPLDVLRPRDRGRPAPVFYLLNGAAGGEDEGNWADKSTYAEFFKNKHVNVVTPLKGKLAYYTDWQRDDPVLGRNKWETFLLDELPPIINGALGTTGKNAIGGLSMGGTSVLNLAQIRPGFYRAVAAYSGCARTSDPIGVEYIKQVVQGRGGGNVKNMWGTPGGPDWRRHDPYIHAGRLRGTSIYISSMSGLPGRDEDPSNPENLKGSYDGEYIDRVVLGGVIEAAMNQCTTQMAERLAQLRIPATIVMRPTGTHSWGYWDRELRASWPQIAAVIG